MSYDSEVAADSPYAYWKLDETSGTTLVDSSGNSRDATLSGTANMAVTGPGGWAALDLASNAYVNSGFSLSSVSDLTIEMWVKTTANSPIFCHQRFGSTPGFLLGLNKGVSPPGNGKPTFGYDASGVYCGRKDTSSALNDDLWHHIVGVFAGSGSVDPTDMTIYVDGVQVDDTSDTYSTPSSLPLALSTLYLGYNSDHGYSGGGFMVARTAIYLSALSGSRIAAHYAELPAISNEGTADGTIGWAGSSVGDNPDQLGAAGGATSWVGSATGVMPTAPSSGVAAGWISWVGAVDPTEVPKFGVAAGSVSWAGGAASPRTTVQKWTFHDPVTTETYVFPISPYQMTTLTPKHSHIVGAAGGHSEQRKRITEAPTQPFDWSFTGRIRTQQQHDDLDEWTRKGYPIHVSDHLGRTWEVLIRSFKPKDLRGRLSTRWEYDIAGTVLGRVS